MLKVGVESAEESCGKAKKLILFSRFLKFIVLTI